MVSSSTFAICIILKRVPKNTRSATSPFIAFAISAAHQAIEDSNLSHLSEAEKERTVKNFIWWITDLYGKGVAIGAGMGYLNDITDVHSLLLNNVRFYLYLYLYFLYLSVSICIYIHV